MCYLHGYLPGMVFANLSILEQGRVFNIIAARRGKWSAGCRRRQVSSSKGDHTFPAVLQRSLVSFFSRGSIMQYSGDLHTQEIHFPGRPGQIRASLEEPISLYEESGVKSITGKVSPGTDSAAE